MTRLQTRSATLEAGLSSKVSPPHWVSGAQTRSLVAVKGACSYSPVVQMTLRRPQTRSDVAVGGWSSTKRPLQVGETRLHCATEPGAGRMAM